MADAELSSILNRRQEINDKLERNEDVKPQFKVKNIYTEFHELTRKDIKSYQDIFNKWVSLRRSCIMSLTFSTIFIHVLEPKKKQNKKTNSDFNSKLSHGKNMG